MTETKHAAKSKINILSLLTAIVAILVMWEVFPANIGARILETMAVATPMAVIILRTFFTSTNLDWKKAPELFVPGTDSNDPD